MTGPHPVLSGQRKARIKKLTEEGLPSVIIAERLGVTVQAIYQHQINHGLRKIENPRKKGGD